MTDYKPGKDHFPESWDVLGHALASVLSHEITLRSSILVKPRVLWVQELPLLLIPVLLGTLSGLLPASMAYRVNVVEKLFVS